MLASSSSNGNQAFNPTAETSAPSILNTPQVVPSVAFAPTHLGSVQDLHSTPHSPLSYPSSISSSRSNSETELPPSAFLKNRLLQRPKLGRRKSSGTMIIPSNSLSVERTDEEYETDDARTMSPRRSSEEIERLASQSRQTMMDQAKALQESLLDILDRVESIKSEHEKLEGGNRFLQSYIGELMQTSKITSVGAPKAKGKARAMK